MMRYLTLSIALGFLLATANPAHAQAAQIQSKSKDSIGKEKAKNQTQKEINELEKFRILEIAQREQQTLENLLAQALKNNPDIRVAEAKMREAEAELNRVKLQVSQKVVAKQREIAGCKDALKYAQAIYERMQAVYDKSVISKVDIDAAEAKLQKAKAELARAEADLPYLLGSRPQAWQSSSLGAKTPDPFKENIFAPFAPPQNPKAESIDFFPPALALIRRGQPPVEPRHSPIPEAMVTKIRKALDTPVLVDFNQVPPKDILDFLQQHAKGFNVVDQAHFEKSVRVSLRLTEPVPVGAVFQFLEDKCGLSFVIREYGIVAAHAGSMPPDFVRLQDFWKSGPAQAMTPPTSGQKK